MKSYIAFTKKELLEAGRTYKLMIMVVVFLILGFMNAPTAKFTPEIVNQFMPAGMEITLAEPTLLDSWTQFFKNVPQMGIIVMVLVFSGMLANEINRGTLINILTKGMGRKTVILSKYTAAAAIWTICYTLSFLTTLLYNQFFWQEGEVYQLVFSVSCVWLFGMFLISCLMLGGSLFKSGYGSLLLTGGIFVIMLILNMLQTIAKYNPLRLITVNMELLTNGVKQSEVYLAAGITAGLTVLILGAGMLVFDKKRL